jgi:putative heme iron utilization protein
MNTDHAHALQDFCKHRFHIQPERVEMIGIDCDGFDVRADDRILRFEFDAPVTDAGAARAALVEMAQQARTV